MKEWVLQAGIAVALALAMIAFIAAAEGGLARVIAATASLCGMASAVAAVLAVFNAADEGD